VKNAHVSVITQAGHGMPDHGGAKGSFEPSWSWVGGPRWRQRLEMELRDP